MINGIDGTHNNTYGAKIIYEVLIEVGGKGGIDRINEIHGIDGMETRNEC